MAKDKVKALIGRTTRQRQREERRTAELIAADNEAAYQRGHEETLRKWKAEATLLERIERIEAHLGL